MNITVIGCGRLGAPYAAGMASLGHHVLGLDTDPTTLAACQAGRAPFAEPGLQEIITEGAVSGRLRFTGDYTEAAEHGDVFFVAVPTPQAQGAEHHDLSAVFAAVDSLARVLVRDSLVVIKSSVPAGTSATVAARLAALVRPGVRVEVAASPDFMREHHSIADVRRPSRIVLGVQPGGNAEQILRELWAPCLDAGVPLVVTTLATAELCKLAANSFLATRISFTNAVTSLAAAVGADPAGLLEVIGHDPRIGHSYLDRGLGFGGSCLSKDLRGAAALAERSGAAVTAGLLRWVDNVNQDRRHLAVALAREAAGGNLSGQRIAVWGASFKPGIDDVRDSPALDVAVRLHRAGALVVVHDPAALGTARAEHPELTYADNPVRAVDGAAVLLHLTGWPVYGDIDPARLDSAAQPVLVDGRPGVLDHDRWCEAGWAVRDLQ